MRKPKPAPRPADVRRPFVFDEDWFELFPAHTVRVRRWHPSDVTHEHDEGNNSERGWIVFAHRNGRRLVRQVGLLAAPPRQTGRLWREVMWKVRTLRHDSFEYVAREEARFLGAISRAQDSDFEY